MSCLSSRAFGAGSLPRNVGSHADGFCRRDRRHGRPGGPLQSLESSRRPREHGAAAVWLAVLFVPVLFGLLGFALDLGILYSVKGELKAAANSMALAAAQKLNGTDASTTDALAAALLTVETTSGSGNRYYFHGLPVGQTSGTLVSTVSEPVYYATSADATAAGLPGEGEVTGSLARFVRVTVQAETPLLFWTFIPIATDRKLAVLATAVAGVSAPLCQACGIEPLAVAALDQSDTADFGFIPDVKYTFAYQCSTGRGSTPPSVLAGSSSLVSYLLLNRFNADAVVFPDEPSQAFRDSAGGLPGSTDSAQACFSVNSAETRWASATPNLCGAGVASIVNTVLCGLDTRLEPEMPAACSTIPGIDTLTTIYHPDPDINTYDLYKDYTGNGRRIITLPVVDALNADGSMTILGFRQFLLTPAQGLTNLNPGDSYGRFVASYVGSVAPLKQGRFDGCTLTAGPGKVVLHQ